MPALPRDSTDRVDPDGGPDDPDSVVGVPLAVAAVVLLALSLRLVFGSSSAVSSEIRQAYHLGPVGAALLTTGPVVCLGLFGPLAARALRRWSVPAVLAACLVVITVGTAARGVPSWAALLGGTLVAGVAIAVANVLGPVLVRQFFPYRIGVMTGLFTALVSASAGLASGATVPLDAHLLHSWRATLAAWAVPALVAVFVFLAIAVRQRRPGATQARVAAGRAARSTPVWRSPMAWAVTGFMGIQSLLAYSMIAWLPTIYLDRGFSAQAAGLLLTALSVASIGTALTVPVVAARMSDQRLLAVGVVALSVAGIAGVLLGSPQGALVWATLLGFGQGGQLSLALAMVNLRSKDVVAAGDLSTMVQSIGYLIAACGPLLTGAVHGMTGGWTTPLLILVALMIPLGVCGWIAGTAQPTMIVTSGAKASSVTDMHHSW